MYGLEVLIIAVMLTDYHPESCIFDMIKIVDPLLSTQEIDSLIDFYIEFGI